MASKAKGERNQTIVVFDAKAMRAARSPAKGSSASAEDVMSKHVRPFQQPSVKVAEHFFEVRIEGLRDAPAECTSPKAMRDFVSQVAPVPFPPEFPYRQNIADAAKANGIPIEEVAITVIGGGKAEAIHKRYGTVTNSTAAK